MPASEKRITYLFLVPLYAIASVFLVCSLGTAAVTDNLQRFFGFGALAFGPLSLVGLLTTPKRVLSVGHRIILYSTVLSGIFIIACTRFG